MDLTELSYSELQNWWEDYKREQASWGGILLEPYWEVFQNSQLVASDGFSMTVTEGYELRVSSLFQDQHALLVSPDGVESSVYQQQDKTRSNFVHVPSGQSTIVVHCGNADCEVEVYEECDLI